FQQRLNGLQRIGSVGSDHPARTSFHPTRDVQPLDRRFTIDDATGAVRHRAGHLVDRQSFDQMAPVANRAQHQARLDRLRPYGASAALPWLSYLELDSLDPAGP